MNKYESVIILQPKTEDKEIEEIIKRINEITTVIGIENLGVKKLAYEVKGNKEGRYLIFQIESDIENIAELEKYYRLEVLILKYLTIKMEE